MKLLLVLVLVSVCSGSFARQKPKDAGYYLDTPIESISDIRNLIPNDRPTPFPWGKESEFPWDTIQGSWVVKDKDFESIYTVRVIKDKATQTKQVFVRQYSTDTCELLSIGHGGVDSKIAWVNMNDQADRVPYYTLQIRSFDQSVMQTSLNYPNKMLALNGKVYVFSIMPYTTGYRQAFHMMAEKTSKKTDISCN